MFSRILLIFCVVAAVAGIIINDDRVEDLIRRIGDIKNELLEDNSELRSEEMKEIIASIPYDSTRKDSAFKDGFLCGMCLAVFQRFIFMRRYQKQSDEYIKKLAIKLCVDFEIQSEEVCSGFVEFNTPSIFHIVDNRTTLSTDTVCKVLLNDGYCTIPYIDTSLDFKVDIDSGKSNKTSETSEQANQSVSNLTIVHFTDIHFDAKYTKGAFADCEEYACCRETDDVNEDDPSSKAGHWGDYRSCDSPLHAIADAFQQIAKQHPKIDAIYFTGDIVDHFMWEVSVDGMKYEIEKVYSLMSEVFGDIPLYPILGNHEPQNIFAPPEAPSSLSVQWLYDYVAELWMEFLPPDALETVRTGGYYTTVIRPGLRLIALNNNVCFIFNWWILYSVESIKDQFQWLHDVLLAAEKAGEKVHILAHIPNGYEDYHEPCSREFRRIVDRFHRTIVGQFNGHTEFFGFNIFYESNNEAKPVNMAWNGGSLATFSGVNRNYMVYDVDPVSYQVTDIESWIYNLTDANQNEMKSPVWFRQFSLRDAFKLDDLTPSTLSNFTATLALNSTAIHQLWRMTKRDSDLALQEGCPKACLQKVLCDILIADNNDTRKCRKIKLQVKGP